MKKIGWAIFISCLLLLFTAAPEPALARPSAPEACAYEGGTWKGDSSGNGYCYYEELFGCQPGEVHRDLFINHEYIRCECYKRTTIKPVQDFDVSYNTAADAWSGNCGVYISSPNFNGSVQISKPQVYTPPGGRSTTVCSFDYLSSTGEILTNFRSTAYVYVNLNKVQASAWIDEALHLYVFDGSSWNICPNTFFVNAGEYGRLACLTNQGTSFGLGTDAAYRPTDLEVGEYWYILAD